MSKIYLFLPDFEDIVKHTDMLPESIGFNHSVFYYEDNIQIYFYKPIGSFVYCTEVLKVIETEEAVDTLGKTQQEIDDLKNKFHAIQVTKMLYVSYIETTTMGVMKQ